MLAVEYQVLSCVLVIKDNIQISYYFNVSDGIFVVMEILIYKRINTLFYFSLFF